MVLLVAIGRRDRLLDDHPVSSLRAHAAIVLSAQRCRVHGSALAPARADGLLLYHLVQHPIIVSLDDGSVILDHASEVRSALGRDDLLLHTLRHRLVALADGCRVLDGVRGDVTYPVHVVASDHIQLHRQVQVTRLLNN